MIRWCIVCLVIIFVGIALLVGMWSGVTIHVVDSEIDNHHRNNLLILYKF